MIQGKIFRYEALDAAGRKVTSQIMALSDVDAVCHIKAQGLFPTLIKEIQPQTRPLTEEESSVEARLRRALSEDRLGIGDRYPWTVMLATWLGLLVWITGSFIGSYAVIGHPHKFWMSFEYPSWCQWMMWIGFAVYFVGCCFWLTRKNEKSK